jgi:integrase
LEREHVRDRGREYTLRGSESRTLATVGAFRVVSSRDLRDHNDRPADPRAGDLRHLREEGLIETVNWGRIQDPPYLTTTPFHRFGVTIKTKEETKRDRRIGLQEEQALLAACSDMGGADHKFVGPAMHDRMIGALETCCRRGEMLRIQSRHVDWERHQIAIPGRHAKDAENRRIPFDPHGRLAPILKRRAALGPSAFVFGSPAGAFVANVKTAWESLLLVANGHETKRAKPGARVDRAKLRQIDLHWHDLRHEGACRLLSDGVDIRTIQLMLGHADIKQTQRYLNITDEELRKAMSGVWERRRQLRAVSQ